jgi:hypothetical protein
MSAIWPRTTCRRFRSASRDGRGTITAPRGAERRLSIGASRGGVKLGALDLKFVYPAADGHVVIAVMFGPTIGPLHASLIQMDL